MNFKTAVMGSVGGWYSRRRDKREWPECGPGGTWMLPIPIPTFAFQTMMLCSFGYSFLLSCYCWLSLPFTLWFFYHYIITLS